MIRLIVYFHQVDDKKTIGPEAFARIAPACPVVADVIIVHNLFDTLTSSSSHRLHFLIFDKYLRSLDKYEMFIDLCWFFKLQFFCIVENNMSIHVNLMGSTYSDSLNTLIYYFMMLLPTYYGSSLEILFPLGILLIYHLYFKQFSPNCFPLFNAIWAFF